MPTSRRQTIIGLGGLLAAGGAVVSTGAFDTVEAERSVGVETAGDASAFLGLEPAPDQDVTSSTTTTWSNSISAKFRWVRE